jgi:hypothetical protein
MRNRLVPFRNPMAESWESVYTFLDLRLKIQIFMNVENKIVVELDDKSEFGICLLCDISQHFNGINP